MFIFEAKRSKLILNCFVVSTGVLLRQKELGPLSSTRVTQMFTARREYFPGDGNHDVHKITPSAESERFGRDG
jgi:hypothetical protein